VEEGYRSLPFPFAELAPPAFEMRERWTLPQYLAYLRSWSATRRFISARGFDPVAGLEIQLEPLWEKDACWVRWPLHLRVGIMGVARGAASTYP
jgi:hypothetical protein